MIGEEKNCKQSLILKFEGNVSPINFIALLLNWSCSFSLSWFLFYQIVINMVQYKGAQPQTADQTSSMVLTRDDQDSKFDLTIYAVSKQHLNCLPNGDPEINLSLVWKRKESTIFCVVCVFNWVLLSAFSLKLKYVRWPYLNYSYINVEKNSFQWKFLFKYLF